jgi:putative SOS response-associated peptidase YedK
MCGRYTLFTSADELQARFGATFDRSFEPRYNAAPGQDLPVVRNDAPETFRYCRWGLAPSWADDPDGGPINARGETVAEKPTFRSAYEKRRCLVPADGFYEWVEGSDGKRPYRVALTDDEPFALAGIWETWTGTRKQTGLSDFVGGGDAGPETYTVESFAILTTEPNELVADLHHRMAVVLPRSEEHRWLTEEDPSDLLRPYPSEKMRAYPVSQAVNDPSNDAPELVDPADV